jgi:homoserine dehydrogenase
MTNIALLGTGNVGRAFARFLARTAETHACRVAAAADISGGVFFEGSERLESTLDRLEQGSLLGHRFAAGKIMPVPQFLQALPGAAVDVLVECLPTNIADGQPALDYLCGVLTAGIPAVTVDKGPVVHGYRRLTEAAASAGVGIAFTGTTGVGPPPGLSGMRIREIQGVLNGTTNFILSRMLEHSIPFAEALEDARSQGIAEPDPTLDVEGWDTACKILILGKRWLGASVELQDVPRTGIGPGTEPLIRSARASGRAVRLIGRACDRAGLVEVSVAPEVVGPESPFFAVTGTSKGAVFSADDGRELFAESRSGRDAIAQTILEDVRAVTAPSRRAGGTP